MSVSAEEDETEKKDDDVPVSSKISKWIVERALSGALLLLVPASAYYYHPIMEYIVAVGLVVHCQMGFDEVLGDYCKPEILGEFMSKGLQYLFKIFSIFALAGLMLLNYKDVGLIQATRTLWKL
jgi:succinate dehydrogenase (ubiquinone) membrane anchor subunit